MAMAIKVLSQGQLLVGDEAQQWVAQRQAGVPFWLDLTEPGPQDVAWLGQLFHFHPLALEDLLGENQRPKLDEYEGYIFLVTRELRLQADKGESEVSVPCLEASEVHFFLAPDYLITVHDLDCNVVARTFDQAVQRSQQASPAPASSKGNGSSNGSGHRNNHVSKVNLLDTRSGEVQDNLWLSSPPKGEQVADEPADLPAPQQPNKPKKESKVSVAPMPTLIKFKPKVGIIDGPRPDANLLANLPAGEPAFSRGLDFLLYSMLDDIADSYFETLDALEGEIDQMEDVVIERPRREVLDGIFTLKNNLMAMRKLTNPMREVLNMIISHQYPGIHEQNLIYFRDVYSLMVSVYEMVDTERDSASNVMSAYLSSVSNDLNVVMKRLTVITTLALPITAITGFAGMNLASLPNDAAWYSLLIYATLIGVPLGMYIFFKRRGWV